MTLLAPLQRKLFSHDPRTVLFTLLCLAAVLILAGIGLRSPWPPDEPRFADVAREMIATGQWFFPARGEELYPDKPPIFMWCIALFYWLTGSIKIAFLLPNAIAGLVTIAAVFDLARRLWDLNVARNAALLLLFTPQFLIQAKFAQIDAMVACYITLGCYGLLRHFFTGPNWRWYFAGWAFMGLGIITKGVGFLPVLLFIPLVIYHFAYQRLSQTLRWPAAFGILAMFAVIALWLVPMVWQVAQHPTAEMLAYRDNILFKQTGDRYVSAWTHFNPWYYFIVSVVPLFWFPGSLFILRLKAVLPALKADGKIAVLLLWAALVIVFFSISPGKRGVYVLPALPMFAIAIAALLQHVTAGKWVSRIVDGLSLLLVTLFAAVALLAQQHHPKIIKKLADIAVDNDVLQYVALLMAGLAVVLLFVFILQRKAHFFQRYATTISIVTVAVSLLIYPLVEPVRTPRAVMEKAVAIAGGNELAIIDFKEQYFLFSPVSVTHFSYFQTSEQQFRNAWAWMQEKPGRVLMVPDDTEFECFKPEGAAELGIAHRQNWLLLTLENGVSECTPPKQRIRFHSAANKAMQVE